MAPTGSISQHYYHTQHVVLNWELFSGCRNSMAIFLTDSDNYMYQVYHVPGTVLGAIVETNPPLLLHLSVSMAILLHTNPNHL